MPDNNQRTQADIAHVSASSIKTLNRCKFAYFLSYILRLPQDGNFKAEQGSMLHKVCEEYGRADKLIALRKKWLTESKDRKKDKKKREKWFKDIARLSKFLDFEGRVYHYYRNTYMPWKFSKYKEVDKLCGRCEFYQKDLDQCQAINKQISDFEGCPREQMRESLRLINNVFKQEGELNPLNRNILAFEKSFVITLENGATIKGFIDMITELNETTLAVDDWKFGAWQPPYDEAIRDVQLWIYAIAASILYPKYENFVCTLEYPRYYFSNSKSNYGTITVVFSKEELEEGKQMIKDAWDYVKTGDLMERTPTWSCEYICYGKKLCDEKWEEHTGRMDKINK